MPDTAPARTPGRRTVRYDTPAAVLADVDRLRRGGYRKVGQWSLPQVCHHLASVMTSNLQPPPTDAPPTAEQLATKAKFFGMVLAPGGMAEGIPVPPSAQPPADCPDAAIDALAAAFDALAAFPHPTQMVGRYGPVSIDEGRQIHLAHCAHHLSFLEPTRARRTLRYGSAADVAADVRHLRAGGYVRATNWTLPQACWHLLAYTRGMLGRPITEPTPDMAAQRPLMEAILAGRPIPDGRLLPDELVPPAIAGEADVDAFLAFLNAFQPRAAMHRAYGPVTAEQMNGLFLAHCGHHLSHLIPEPGGTPCPPPAA